MIFRTLCLLGVVASLVEASVRNNLLFVETFDTDPFLENRWFKSTDPKYVDDSEKPAIHVKPSNIPAKGFESDKGVMLTKEHKHYGFGSKFASPISMQGHNELVFQYEVKLEENLNCGGAYIKLLRDTPDFDITSFNGDSPYTIMFGPDKCGTNNKVHFIVQHQNPLTSVWEEKHHNETAAVKGDRKTHLYTLVVRNDNSFEVFIDKKSAKKGSLLTHLKPAINPPKEIDDPTDSKPADWVEEAKINDPAASKPEDWDEEAPKTIEDVNAVKPATWLDDGQLKIPDPKAVKPADWDDEEDGEWEAPQVDNPDCEKFGCGEWKRPMIKNPAYKGKWKHPKIDNPDYKGPWKARQVPNPAYFEDASPALGLAPMAAMVVEIWTINGGIFFDNFAVAASLDDAWAFADATFTPKMVSESAKEKKETKEKTKKAREEKKKSGTPQEKIIIHFNEMTEAISDYFQQNLLVASGVTGGLGLLLVYLLFFGGSSKATPRQPRRPAGELTEPVPKAVPIPVAGDSTEPSAAAVDAATEPATDAAVPRE